MRGSCFPRPHGVGLGNETKHKVALHNERGGGGGGGGGCITE